MIVLFVEILVGDRGCLRRSLRGSLLAPVAAGGLGRAGA
jgi:hypothetical protein